MLSSWLCCLLPLAGMLLLGQPTQGGLWFQSPPDPPAAGKYEARHVMWAKQKDMLLKQVLQAQAQVLLHLNKKHNATFFMAPKETTHIMVQMTFGHVYHVRTVLVEAECPEHYTDDLRTITAKDCKSQPESPKMECSLDVFEFYGMDSYIIDGEECHEYPPPPTSLDNPDNSADPAYPPNQEDEGSPAVRHSA